MTVANEHAATITEKTAEVGERKAEADVLEKDNSFDKLEALVATPEATARPVNKADATAEPAPQTTATAAVSGTKGDDKKQVAATPPKPTAPKLA